MPFKRFLPKVLLIAGFAVLFLIIVYQSPIKDIWLLNLERLQIYIDNFFNAAGPEPRRQRPISLLQKEIELKLYIGEPFKGFSETDWNDFWRFVYGGYPKELPGKQGLPMKMRQLTTDEIASELAFRYPQPFAYFTERHWKTFFDILFAK